MLLLLVTALLSLLELAHCVCQFQTPFYFVERPSVVTVVDSSGQMVADRSIPNIFCVNKNFVMLYRVRVSWGRVQNFKCVDYFQVLPTRIRP